MGELVSTKGGSIRVHGDREMLDALGRVAAFFGLKDDRLVKIVGTELREGVRENFRLKSSPSGVPWRALSVGSHGGGRSGDPLRDTSKLYNSFALRFDGNSKVAVGTNEISAATHNFGDPNRRSKKPGGFLALPVNRAVARERAAAGDFRAAYPDAFVIRMGGASYGYDRLWLVRAPDGSRKRRGVIGNITKRSRKDVTFGRGARSSISGRNKLEFLALLVKSVDIPARPFMGLRADRKVRIIYVLQLAARVQWRETKRSLR